MRSLQFKQKLNKNCIINKQKIAFNERKDLFIFFIRIDIFFILSLFENKVIKLRLTQDNRSKANDE